ncbi:MAG: hypothetical protein JWN04_695, partial [Myxococcaceae bacterium]|nr:hypothetical protein [Myxococcaceae bacterium]
MSIIRGRVGAMLRVFARARHSFGQRSEILAIENHDLTLCLMKESLFDHD